MVIDQTGTLANVKRHDYLPFGEELFAGSGGRTVGLGYAGGDGVRQQFTAKERDNQTDLDYFGARYHSSSQGRFSGVDPLYIEMRRLPYPQAWNLYGYTRNNPLKFIDNDGLELKLTCTTTQDCDKTVEYLNNRKGGQFKTKLKDGTLRIVGEVDKTKLSKSELALYNAIVNPTITATLEIISSSDLIDFGYSALNNPKHTPGLNLIDRSDLNQLNNANPALAGEVVAHEAMEAFGSAGGIPSYELAHVFANQFFGNVEGSSPQGLPTGAASITSARRIYNFKRLGIEVTVEKTFVTPQPAESLPQSWDRTRGNIRVIPPTQEKKP
jgi:RHS repeat-associated protein